MTIAEQIENIRNYINAVLIPNGNKNIKAENVNTPLNAMLDVLQILNGSGGGSYVFKNNYSIIADVTPGFVSGTNTVTQDEWIGWDFIPVRTGFGALVLDTDFSYDKTTGQLTLLRDNDKFGPEENVFIMFQPKTTT